MASFPFSPSAWKSVSDMTAEAERETTASASARSSGDSAGKFEAEIRKNDALCLETCFWLMVGIVSRFQSMFQKKIPGFDRFSKNVHLLVKIFISFSHRSLQVPPCLQKSPSSRLFRVSRQALRITSRKPALFHRPVFSFSICRSSSFLIIRSVFTLVTSNSRRAAHFDCTSCAFHLD